MSEHDLVDELLDRIRWYRSTMASTSASTSVRVRAIRLAQGSPTARRLRATHALLDEYEYRVHELAEARRDLIDALLAEGWNQTEVAAMLGITRSRVSQLMRKRRPELNRKDPTRGP